MLHKETEKNVSLPFAERSFFCVQDAMVSVRHVERQDWVIGVLGSPERIAALSHTPPPATLIRSSMVQHQYACTSEQQAHEVARFVLERISDQGASLCVRERLEQDLAPAVPAPRSSRRL